MSTEGWENQEKDIIKGGGNNKTTSVALYYWNHINTILNYKTNPKELLKELSKIQMDVEEETGIQSWWVFTVSLDWTFWWSFTDYETLKIDEVWRVVLMRVADDEIHLIKEGQSFAWIEDLLRTSEFHWYGNWVPTSSFWNWAEQFRRTEKYKVIWEFRIPIEDLKRIFREWKAVIWNVWEWEIVLAPEVAKEYLYSTKVVWNKKGADWLPDEIFINFW